MGKPKPVKCMKCGKPKGDRRHGGFFGHAYVVPAHKSQQHRGFIASILFAPPAYTRTTPKR